MKIGIDFDNTIACYSDVFYKAARERDLIPEHVPSSKGQVRDYLRSIGKENDWIELQGYVYGARMDLAPPFEGVADFFLKSKNDLFIISHKTLHPYMGPKYDLHKAAKDWLKKQPFFAKALAAYFELTLKEKLQRIGTMECDYFIDDLPELLLEKEFPAKVNKILFDPSEQYEDHPSYKRFRSWSEIDDFFQNAPA